MAEDGGKKEEQFDFTSDGEEIGYIVLDQARLQAVQTAREAPGNYGAALQSVPMVYEVVDAEETEDDFILTLTFRPEGEFTGTPGREQFVFRNKTNQVAFRQVLSLPRLAGGRRFPLLPVAIGVVIVGVIAAIGVVAVLMGSGDEGVTVAEMPPMETQDSSETLAPTYTPRPTYTPAPTLTPNPTFSPTNTPQPTRLPTATHYPTPTPYPTLIPKPTSGAVFVTEWEETGAHGIALASDNILYFADSNRNRVQKFTSDGVFIRKWGSLGGGNGGFSDPRYVAVAPDGSVYVTDHTRIQKFTSDGVFVSQWGTYGSGDGQFSSPMGVAVAEDGSVYVADEHNSRIQKFTSDGVFVSQWGTYGSGDGEFNNPIGVAVAPDGSVYISDRSRNLIQKFTPQGGFISKWGTEGTGDGEFSRPRGITVASDSSVYVVDTGNNRIQKFTSEGVFVTKWGTYNYIIQRLTPDGSEYVNEWAEEGEGDGQFNQPYGVAVASDGSVYVADLGNKRIQKFSVVP